MDVREKLRELGATDQQLSAKVVDLIEEALAELSDEEKAEVGTKTAIEIRNDLELNLKLMRDTIKGLNEGTRMYRQAKEEGWKAIVDVRRELTPYAELLSKNPDLSKMDDTMKAIATYKGMLESTKEVYGEWFNEEVAIKSIEAASFGTWRVIMGNKWKESK